MESVPGQTGVRSQPMIAVRDVRASTRWYRQLLGLESLPEHSHRDVYDRMFFAGQLVLQVHAWDEHDHPNLVNADAAPLGHGVLLWFEVDDFDAVVERARALHAPIIEEPHLNPRPNHMEVWLRDPDGYVVVVASPDREEMGS
jgi:catechol 2,3-dioxygenase-like lactoylglutathione lyase family enzyme